MNRTMLQRLDRAEVTHGSQRYDHMTNEEIVARLDELDGIIRDGLRDDPDGLAAYEAKIEAEPWSGLRIHVPCAA